MELSKVTASVETMAASRTKRIKISADSPLEQAKAACQAYQDPPGFDVKHINDIIGEGVFTTKTFYRGEFLLEYRGELIEKYSVARQLEKEYEEKEQGSFMYFFKYNSKTMCIDATHDLFFAGRMVNDARKGDIRNNAEMRIVPVDGKPHLCLFATKDIAPNNELRFDYGVANLPWRKADEVQVPEEENDVSIEASKNDVLTERELVHDGGNVVTTEEPTNVVVTDEDLVNEWGSDVRNEESQYDVLANVDMVSEGGNDVRTAESQNVIFAYEDMANEGENDRRTVELKNDDLADENLANERENDVETALESPHLRMTDSQTKIFFCGIRPNMGFLMLFQQYLLTENAEEAKVIVVQASHHGQTDCSAFELFASLVHRKTIVSNRWIKESLLAGTTLDMENFLVTKIHRYGEICQESNYQEFKFELRGDRWVDITKDQLLRLIKDIGGIPVINSTDDTVIVCADNMLHTSSKCVSKEWVFKCIVNGKNESIEEKTTDEDIVYESDDSCVVSKDPLNKILVATSGSSKGKGRSLKAQCCIYCEKLDYKLHRHLEQHHANEVEVAKVLNMKKGSKERRRAWAIITAQGNNLHNSKVKEKGMGVLIPKYRQKKEQDAKKYLPCEFCRMLIVSTDLWKHHKSCVNNTNRVKSDAPVKNSKLLDACCSSEKSGLGEQFHKKVVVNIRDDVVGQCAKSDSLILKFGERRFEKTGKSENSYSHIACRMRELARLAIAMKKKHASVDNLSKCIQPIMWTSLLETIKDIAGFDTNACTFRSPSYVEKVGNSLKKVAKMLRTQASVEEDKIQEERITRFLKCYEDEYYDRMVFMAKESLAIERFNKPKLLPIVEDVVLLSTYLRKEAEKIKACKRSDPKEIYSSLCKVSLAEIILFNRKRSGEAERLKVDDFMKGSVNENVDEDISKTLSKFEKQLCRSHYRIETRGKSLKRGRKVSILLTKSMKENLDMLLQLQSELQINSKYIFIRPSGRKPYRGNDVLKQAAEKANVRHASRITSTGLRKQLATLSQVINLTESSQDILATFMGHDIRIHREYYRLPEGTLEVAKVSKILHLLNTGKITSTEAAKLHGDNQSLIDNETTISDEEDSSDEDAADSDDTDTCRVVSTSRPEPAVTSAKPHYGLQKTGDPDTDDDVGDPDWVEKKDKHAVDSEDSDYSDDELRRQKQKKKQKKTCGKTKWTPEEVRVVMTAFEKYVHLNKLPGKSECDRLLRENPCLGRRSWRNVKDFVRNKTTKLRNDLKFSKAKPKQND